MSKTSTIASIVLAFVLLGYWYIAREPTTSPRVTLSSIIYHCRVGGVIGAKFYEEVPTKRKAVINNKPPVPTGSVDITLGDGRSMHLRQTISASGVRYANSDESFIFWTKGKGVIILENGKESTFIDCEEGTRPVTSATTSRMYKNDTLGFSIIIPSYTIPPQLEKSTSYLVNESYTYGLIPGEVISGVSFTIPKTFYTGTNLSSDTYFSVEHIDNAKTCTGDMFMEKTHSATTITEHGITYSVASSSDAAAGNRYEETVYATKASNTCIAVRYFIHYGAYENYPTGTIKEFNKQDLLNTFNTIRKTLVIQK